MLCVQSAESLFGVLGGSEMPVKIKIIRSRPSRVDVTVRRPGWQEYIQY